MGFMTDEQLEMLVEEQAQNPGQLIGRIALDMGLISDDQLAQGLAEQMDIQYVDLEGVEFPESVLREITDAMFLVAARTVAAHVSAERLAESALFPPVHELREVSRAVAIEVVREARDSGRGRAFHDEQIAPAVDAAMWFPRYVRYEPA